MIIKNLLLTVFITLCFTTATFAQKIPTYVPTNGLIAWWPFNGNANDESGNGYQGTVKGVSLTADRFGNSNSAYSFNGKSDYISVNNSFDFEERTFSVWFNPFTLLGSRNDAGHILTMDDNDLVYGKMTIKIEDSLLTVRSGGEPNRFIDSIKLTNKWYNMILTRNSSTTKYYMNGVLIGEGKSGSAGSTANPNPNLVIGSGRIYSPQNFFGLIDDVGIWDRELTECEIQELYNAQPSNFIIDNSVTITGNILTTNQTGATYQWLDCDKNNAKINDETNQSFTPKISGNYSVEITLTNGACSKIDTSDCQSFVYVGLDKSTKYLISVYPNPAKNVIYIKTDVKLIGSKYNVYNSIGKLVLSGEIHSENVTIELGNLSKGIYLISIDENTKQTIKVIKE